MENRIELVSAAATLESATRGSARKRIGSTTNISQSRGSSCHQQNLERDHTVQYSWGEYELVPPDDARRCDPDVSPGNWEAGGDWKWLRNDGGGGSAYDDRECEKEGTEEVTSGPLSNGRR
jgi:hypothetical protein